MSQALRTIEELTELAMHLTRIGSAIRLLVLEAVQLRKDVDREGQVVVCKAAQASRVVKKDVGIEDEVLTLGIGGDETEIAGLRLGKGTLGWRLAGRGTLDEVARPHLF